MMSKIFLLYFYLNLIDIPSTISSQGRIKIVKEIPSAGEKSLFSSDDADTLPSDSVIGGFSGPDHLRELTNSCFSHVDDKYKYILCPFSNVTQEEVKELLTQDSYKGVMGRWGEWIINSNKFAKMFYMFGSKCGGGLRRSISVEVKCGLENKFSTVTEPKRCRYSADFYTPLACGRNALTVYPRLTEELQSRWDSIETDKNEDVLTHKGYTIEMDKVFVEAGYKISEERKHKFIAQFDGEGTCQTKIAELELKISNLERELEAREQTLKTIIDDTKKTKDLMNELKSGPELKP